MIDLEALKAKAKAATPGSWFYTQEHGVFVIGIPLMEKWIIASELKLSDAAYIAAASPDVVLSLIERIETMKQALTSICLTYGHAGESIEDDYAYVYKLAREALKAGEGKPVRRSRRGEESMILAMHKKYSKVIKHEKKLDRWGDGIEHHPKSVELMEFLAAIDFEVYGDHFGWKIGGDGDSGESLMFEMDAFFEAKDRGEL